MPYTLANTFCEKLHQLGERVELFLFGSTGSLVGKRAIVKSRFVPISSVDYKLEKYV